MEGETTGIENSEIDLILEENIPKREKEITIENETMNATMRENHVRIETEIMKEVVTETVRETETMTRKEVVTESIPVEEDMVEADTALPTILNIAFPSLVFLKDVRGKT